jgi:4-amino-4-deoxy-L-arabinose transferase-like glycosyltransferase
MVEMKPKTLIIALLAILALLVLLRVFNVGHVLGYDEAWNVNSVVDAATGHTGDVFYNNFLRHPPLYTGLGALYAAATGAGRSGVALAMEIMSLVFSAGLAVVIFLCGREWFDDLAGLGAAFLFAVMPAARVYDTLVKQESMTLLLGMLFALFFFRRRYAVSGVFLGLAMLTKEIFIFFPAAVFLFLLATRRLREMKGFLLSAGLGVAMSFWWYLFVSNSRGEFFRFFLGRSQESVNWKQPWHFYLGRLGADTGWVALSLALAAAVFLALHIAREGWPGWSARARAAAEGTGPENERETNGRKWEMAMLPLLMILFVYLFLSLSIGKPPWLVYSALPAFALLGGWGASEGYRVLAARRRIAIAVAAAVVAACLALSLPVGFSSFLKRADITYTRSLTYERVAAYMNARMPAEGRVLLRVNDFSPNLAFYLKSYQPDSVFLLPDRPDAANEGNLGQGFTVLLVGRGDNAAGIAGHIDNTRPDFVMMRPGFKATDGTDPAAALAALENPYRTGGVWVFDGRRLADALGPYLNP